MTFSHELPQPIDVVGDVAEPSGLPEATEAQESQGLNSHYSDQRGHHERGVINRALRLANAQPGADVDAIADVVSRGQLYLDRRHYVPRYPKDGRR